MHTAATKPVASSVLLRNDATFNCSSQLPLIRQRLTTESGPLACPTTMEAAPLMDPESRSMAISVDWFTSPPLRATCDSNSSTGPNSFISRRIQRGFRSGKAGAGRWCNGEAASAACVTVKGAGLPLRPACASGERKIALTAAVKVDYFELFLERR